MKRTASFLIAALVWGIAACAPIDNDVGDAQPTALLDAQSADAQDKVTRLGALTPPSPHSILNLLYERDGKGARSFKVDGGDVISYWYGYAFDVKGEHYFTGFTSRSDATDGPQADSMTMTLGQVSIGQVTLVKVTQAGQKAWSQIARDSFVGEFGKLDQPEAIDESRSAVSQKLSDGRLLLGVPTRLFEHGVAISTYAMFLFDRDGLPLTPFRVWTYVGTIQAGSDNSAACEDGALTCAASNGELSFESSVEGALPRIRVALSGQTVVGPGQTRLLEAEDALIYEFDANAERYRAH